MTRSFLPEPPGRGWVFLIACCAALSFSSAAWAEYPAFAPPGQHFTIPFPANAAEEDTTPKGNTLHQWTSTDADFAYIVGHIISSGKPFTGSELTGDLADFVKGSNATILSQENTGWPTPDGRATAVQFHFRMSNGLVGRGVFVLDGADGYSALILDRHLGGDSPYMTQYINSLTILP